MKIKINKHILNIIKEEVELSVSDRRVINDLKKISHFKDFTYSQLENLVANNRGKKAAQIHKEYLENKNK